MVKVQSQCDTSHQAVPLPPVNGPRFLHNKGVVCYSPDHFYDRIIPDQYWAVYAMCDRGSTYPVITANDGRISRYPCSPQN